MEKSEAAKSSSDSRLKENISNSEEYSRKSMFRPWQPVSEFEGRTKGVTFSDEDKPFRQPRPVHTNTSFASEHSYDDYVGMPVDMRKASVGLQVDGNDDLRESMKSESSPESEENTLENSSETNTNSGNLTTENSTQQSNADQTPTQYSEVYGQNSTQHTPTEPSSPPSGMAVLPDTTGSTVEGYMYYYGEELEYQPEGYRNISTSNSASSSPHGSTAEGKEADQEEERKEINKVVDKESGDQLSSCEQMLASFEGSSGSASGEADGGVMQSEGSSSEGAGVTQSQGTSSEGASSAAVDKLIEKEARAAISLCDVLLGSIEGSHLDMLTISVISSGSMNSTMDMGLRQGSQDSGNKSSSTVTLEVTEADSNYQQFRRGINASSSPSHQGKNLAPTQLCPQPENASFPDTTSRNDKCLLDCLSPEDDASNGKRRN